MCLKDTSPNLVVSSNITNLIHKIIYVMLSRFLSFSIFASLHNKLTSEGLWCETLKFLKIIVYLVYITCKD